MNLVTSVSYIAAMGAFSTYNSILAKAKAKKSCKEANFLVEAEFALLEGEQ